MWAPPALRSTLTTFGYSLLRWYFLGLYGKVRRSAALTMQVCLEAHVSESGGSGKLKMGLPAVCPPRCGPSRGGRIKWVPPCGDVCSHGFLVAASLAGTWFRR